MKLIPWWHHPNHNYVGRHRGTFKFWPKKRMLSLVPIGKRDIRIRLYEEIRNEALVGTPNSTTLAFTSVS